MPKKLAKSREKFMEALKKAVEDGVFPPPPPAATTG